MLQRCGTGDGGRAWRRATVPGLTATGALGLAFVSARQGWLAANLSPATGILHGVILHTADGGRSRRQQYPLPAPSASEEGVRQQRK